MFNLSTKTYKICQAQVFGRSSGYFIHGFEFVPV